jgi:hypothetical protein
MKASKPHQIKDSISTIWESLRRKYSGVYVAVVDGRAIVSGKSQLTVYQKAEKDLPKDKEIGIYYVPARSAHPLLL